MIVQTVRWCGELYAAVSVAVQGLWCGECDHVMTRGVWCRKSGSAKSAAVRGLCCMH